MIIYSESSVSEIITWKLTKQINKILTDKSETVYIAVVLNIGSDTMPIVIVCSK